MSDQVETISPYVFTNPATGDRYYSGQWAMKMMMEQLCKKVGVKKFGFHAIRHYVACKLRDSGKVSPFEIQNLLGHTKFGTTDEYLKGLSPTMNNTTDVLDEPDGGTEKGTKNSKGIQKGHSDLLKLAKK